jgi:hypothetical protein
VVDAQTLQNLHDRYTKNQAQTGAEVRRRLSALVGDVRVGGELDQKA